MGRQRARVDQSSSDQDNGEGSVDGVEEQEEVMMVEQAELMEHYRNDFFRQLKFSNYERFRM